MNNFSIDPSLYGDANLKALAAGAEAQPHAPPPASQMDLSPLAATDPGAPQRSDVDEMLRKKRKTREHKACYPCRQRKVKCDLSRPCQTCRERDHPELCDYNPPNKRQSVEHPDFRAEDPFSGGTTAPGSVTLGRAEFDTLCRKLTGLESSIAELRHELARHSDNQISHPAYDPALAGGSDGPDQKRHRPHSHTELHGLHAKNQSGEVIHFGAGSIPAMLWALRDGHTDNLKDFQEVLGKSILPLFALDNESATYPFVDLWGLPHGSQARAQELAKAVPDDQQTLNLCRYYKSLAYVIYPGVADIDEFERDLNDFLLTRATQVGSSEGVTDQTIYGKSYYWVGLLFAILASGAQSSSMPRKERELTSQVYICCAMECARFTNFLSRAKLETIQTLLVVQNVLSNNMNAGTAWSLLGLTIRLAQGLGLHQPCPPKVPDKTVYPRSKIWWAVVWQDSLLSIIYDRAAGDSLVGSNTTPMPMEYGPVPPYHASMYRLVKAGLDIVHSRGRMLEMDGAALHAALSQQHADISSIMRESAEYLKDSRRCKTPQETLEHWGLYLHSSYSLSELCRPALSPRRADDAQQHRALCIENLVNTVDAFLGLNNITAYARQSWASLHRGLSSALLLGILGEHAHNARARTLLARFVSAMHDITVNIDPQEIGAPLQRGITALRKLNITPAAHQQHQQPVASAQDGTALDADGALRLTGDLFTPPQSVADTAGEDSPHSILNTILWGAAEPMGDAGSL